MAWDKLHPDLRRVLEAVEIVSPTSFLLCDKPFETTEALTGTTLEDALADAVYERLFIRRSLRRPGNADRRRHLARLCEANLGTGTWNPDWHVLEEGGRHAVVEKEGVRYEIDADELRREADGGVRVRLPKEICVLVPGFYMAFGDADEATAGDGPVPRLYWHLRADAAPTWMRALTGTFNRRGIPFRLKVLADPVAYVRADAGVVYLAGGMDDAARAAVADVWAEVRGGLRSSVPLFTARLAAGLGGAEGEDLGSFGKARCRLVARALVDAFEEGAGNEERAARLVASFRDAGLDPRRPYLAAGSQGAWPMFPPFPPPSPPSTGAEPTKIHISFILTAAQQLGDALCQDAFRDADLCNWIGHGKTPHTFVALGPELYDGSAGIALFLAELAALTGDEHHRRTALAALRRSLDVTHESPPERPLAFYTGQLGIVWAARRITALLEDDDFRQRADDLLGALITSAPGTSCDIINGHAGSILGLLDLYRSGAGEPYLDLAVRLGEVLAKTPWQEPLLTGFSHGAAGMGLALLELHAVTGRGTFLAAADAAFTYEDGLFDAGVRNWPDLRDLPGAEGRAFVSWWCHGAPGIALSRLRAMSVDPDRAPRYETAARRGLDTTLEALSERLGEGGADTSLCHGICGLVEVVSVAAKVLGDDAPARAAREAVPVLLDNYAASRGRHPSLLLGAAGAGHTLLRLATEAVPSVLLIGA